MSNKTKRLAQSLLAGLSIFGTMATGVSAAETKKTSATTDTKKSETGKTESKTGQKKGGSPVPTVGISLAALVGGGAFGAFLGSKFLGGSGDIKASDGKSVDYNMTALVKISQGKTQELLGNADTKANIVQGDYQSIAYAVAEACNVYAEGGANAAPSKVANIAQLGKKLPDATNRSNGFLANGTVVNALTEELGVIEWDFGANGLICKDPATTANRPMNDLMMGIGTSDPFLANALVRTKAKVKLEKEAGNDKKCKLTVTVGGKIITMTDIAADGKYKDTKVEVTAATA